MGEDKGSKPKGMPTKPESRSIKEGAQTPPPPAACPAVAARAATEATAFCAAEQRPRPRLSRRVR